jgi:hypothetical protein
VTTNGLMASLPPTMAIRRILFNKIAVASPIRRRHCKGVGRVVHRRRLHRPRAAPSRVQGSLVHFMPGARTAWHRHPLGQTLFVTEGIGLRQRRGGPVEVIRPVDDGSTSLRRVWLSGDHARALFHLQPARRGKLSVSRRLLRQPSAPPQPTPVTARPIPLSRPPQRWVPRQ